MYIKLFEDFPYNKKDFTREEFKIFYDYICPILIEGKNNLDNKVLKILNNNSFFDINNGYGGLYCSYFVKSGGTLQSFSDDFSRHCEDNFSQNTYDKLFGWSHLFYSLYNALKRDREPKSSILYEYKMRCCIPNGVDININKDSVKDRLINYVKSRLSGVLDDNYKLYRVKIYTYGMCDKNNNILFEMHTTIEDKTFVFKDPFN